MSDAVKTNFTLLPVTVNRMEDLCKVTFRSKGNLIDWLVAEAYERIDDLLIFGKVYVVVSVSTLPRPPDCEPVPLVEVAPESK